MSNTTIIKDVLSNLLSKDLRRSCSALLLRYKYWRTITRLKRINGRRRIVVAFFVSEIAKWKAQSLYNKLLEGELYRPVILVYPSPLDYILSDTHVEKLLEEKIDFFKDKNMEVVSIWDNSLSRCIIPNDFRPDIVFYQQPWDMQPSLFPSDVANYALTFYIPYYLVNNFSLELDLGQILHRQVYGYIVLNAEHAKFYDSNIKTRHYAGKRIGLGHTIVDNLMTKITNEDEKCVIYAPHYSFPVPGQNRPLTYSSFLNNGKLILELAKQHPEIKWVFKPHPKLKSELKKTGIWTEAEINSYFSEWAELGEVCETSDYIEAFQKSSVMITDCGSFLTEYSCMNKPLIRLYYHKENLSPNPILKSLFSTFYYAHNNDELVDLFEHIICHQSDPNRVRRYEEIVKLRLDKGDAASRIRNYLDTLLALK